MTNNTQKFTKVRAGWYTLTVVSWEEHFETDAEKLSIDVSFCEARKTWVVSHRDDTVLNTDLNFITDFEKARAAKAYAKDYAAYRADKSGETSRPVTYADKYFDLDEAA